MVSCPVQENFQKISVCWHPPHAAFFLRRADHRSNMVKFNEFLRSSHCDRPSQAPSPFADAGRATLSHSGQQAPAPLIGPPPRQRYIVPPCLAFKLATRTPWNIWMDLCSTKSPAYFQSTINYD